MVVFAGAKESPYDLETQAGVGTCNQDDPFGLHVVFGYNDT